MTQSTAAKVHSEPVRKVVTVRAPRDVAWRVFTGKMGGWWPLTTHKIGQSKAVDAVIEPHVGGRWYERGEDGTTCDWGRVLVWEPGSRLVLSWEITADWKHDASLQTEVEVRFIEEGADLTRVELEHRHMDRYGSRAQEMRSVFDSEGGWSGLLASFSRRVEAGA